MTNLAITAEKLLEAAEKVGQLAEQESREAEKNATVSDNVVSLIKEAKLHRLMLPKKYGGPQVDLATFAKIVRKVAYYNMSAAWLTYFFALHNVLPSYLPPQARDEIVNQGGLIADIFAPVGKGEIDGEGFRLSGVYNYGSGILFSDWVGLGVFLQLPENEQPEFCMLILPTSQVTINKNWDTFGLRATGSHQVVVDNVYVPRERMIRLQVIDSTWRPPEEDYDKDYPYYHVPFFPAYFMGFPSMALGATERILTEVRQYSQKRLRVLEGIKEGDTPRAHRLLAEMTTDFHSAEALMNQYLELLEGHRHGQVIGRGKFYAIRTKIIKTCMDIAVRSLQAIGSEALYKGGIVEQHLRDILSLATHKTSLYEDALSAYGLELFGKPSQTMG